MRANNYVVENLIDWSVNPMLKDELSNRQIPGPRFQRILFSNWFSPNQKCCRPRISKACGIPS